MCIEQIGRELKSIRSRNNWTLEKASEITGIHKNTLCLYENNPEVIKLGRLFEILEKYNVDNEIFFKNVCEYIRNFEEKIPKENDS